MKGLSQKDLEANSKGETVFSLDHPPKEPVSFKTSDELLETAGLMFVSRYKARNADGDSKNNQKILAEKSNLWKEFWYSSFNLTERDVALRGIIEAHNLSNLEIDIVILLLLEQLALLDEEISGRRGINSCECMIKYLGLSNHNKIQAIRCLSEKGKLYNAGLISYEDPNEDLKDRELVVCRQNMMDN